MLKLKDTHDQYSLKAQGQELMYTKLISAIRLRIRIYNNAMIHQQWDYSFTFKTMLLFNLFFIFPFF